MLALSPSVRTYLGLRPSKAWGSVTASSCGSWPSWPNCMTWPEPEFANWPGLNKAPASPKLARLAELAPIWDTSRSAALASLPEVIAPSAWKAAEKVRPFWTTNSGVLRTGTRISSPGSWGVVMLGSATIASNFWLASLASMA